MNEVPRRVALIVMVSALLGMAPVLAGVGLQPVNAEAATRVRALEIDHSRSKIAGYLYNHYGS